MNTLITGVSSGLGKNLTIECLSRGDRVWGISRKTIDNPIIKNLMKNMNFFYTQCDVSKEEEIILLMDEMKNKKFSPDIVILNAALMQNDIIDKKFNYAKFKEIFNINFFGAITFIDKILPVFQQKGHGIFIGISSLASYRAVVFKKIAYSTTKAALSMAFESFRLQIAHPNIRFLIVNQGPLTEEKERIWDLSYKKAARKVISYIYKKRNVFNSPLLPYLKTKIFQLLPDNFISKYILKTK